MGRERPAVDALRTSTGTGATDGTSGSSGTSGTSAAEKTRLNLGTMVLLLRVLPPLLLLLRTEYETRCEWSSETGQPRRLHHQTRTKPETETAAVGNRSLWAAHWWLLPLLTPWMTTATDRLSALPACTHRSTAGNGSE